jgi:hypothetical protein
MTEKYKTVRVGFLKAKQATILDWIIAVWTRGPYSHALFLFDDQMVVESMPGIGVRKRRFAESTENNMLDFVKISLLEHEVEKLRQWALSHVDDPYDWRGISSFICPCLGEVEDDWTCSEFVTEGLRQLNYFPFFIVPSRISPNKLFKILKKVR